MLLAKDATQDWDDMAYLVTQFWPGASMDEYYTTASILWRPNGLPEGEAYHAAGPTDGGVLIAGVWESSDQLESFLTEKLSLHTSIDGGLRGEPEQRIAEIGNLVMANPTL